MVVDNKDLFVYRNLWSAIFIFTEDKSHLYIRIHRENYIGIYCFRIVSTAKLHLSNKCFFKVHFGNLCLSKDNSLVTLPSHGLVGITVSGSRLWILPLYRPSNPGRDWIESCSQEAFSCPWVLLGSSKQKGV